MTAIRHSKALVTGAASGIGRRLCEVLKEQGATVIAVDRDEAGLSSLAEALGDDLYPRVCDLSDVSAIEALAEDMQADFGGIDILINNAGVVSGTWLEETRAESIETTFRVNALAPIHLTRSLLPGMLSRDQGHILTLASAAAIAGAPRLVDYSASKAAAVGFNDALRLELHHRGSNIQTTVVCPFFIDTGMFEGVKTRWPWLLPILKPEAVVQRCIRAIEKNRPRVVTAPGWSCPGWSIPPGPLASSHPASLMA